MRQKIAAIMQRRSIQILVSLVSRYHTHEVSGQGAALAYFLLFSLFPLLILISSLIGQLELDLSGLLSTLAPVLPGSVLTLTEAYLSYVSEHVSMSMLFFSAVFSVWFPLRATRCLLHAVRRAYALGAPKRRLRYAFRVVFFTVLLVFCLVITLLLMTLGSRLMQALGSVLSLPQQFPRIWAFARFAALGAVIFAAVFALYAAAQDTRCSLRSLLPGAAMATLAWLVLSFGYSFYAENISNYSAVYGALGAVVVLLIWLYLTGLTLIMGAEFNHILLHADAAPPRQHRRFDQGETV